ncbi:hypothetical protein AC578_7064 [Pseudocercospora eumusae]|uniref:Uncharacterized protein n=1 Tax=Pseudocercospora eumusae TaxID=321146 RepID=A0A139HFR7_9PEZI|nr:hypothetical protein AC578_7064 [Pseudocercospora eumusae]
MHEPFSSLLPIGPGIVALIYINRRPMCQPLHPLWYIAVLILFLWPCARRRETDTSTHTATSPLNARHPASNLPIFDAQSLLACSTPLKHHAIALVSNLTQQCTDYWQDCELSASLSTAYSRSRPPRYEVSPLHGIHGRSAIRSKLDDIRLNHQFHHINEWKVKSSMEQDIRSHADCLQTGGSWWWWRTSTITDPLRFLHCWAYRHLQSWTQLYGKAEVWKAAAVKDIDSLLQQYTDLSEDLIPHRMLLDEQYRDALEIELQRQIASIRRAHDTIHDLQTRLLISLTSLSHAAGLRAWSYHRQHVLSNFSLHLHSIAIPITTLPPAVDELLDFSATIARFDSEWKQLLHQRANPLGNLHYTRAAVRWIDGEFEALTPLACWGVEYPFEKYFVVSSDVVRS